MAESVVELLTLLSASYLGAKVSPRHAVQIRPHPCHSTRVVARHEKNSLKEDVSFGFVLGNDDS